MRLANGVVISAFILGSAYMQVAGSEQAAGIFFMAAVFGWIIGNVGNA